MQLPALGTTNVARITFNYALEPKLSAANRIAQNLEGGKPDSNEPAQ